MSREEPSDRSFPAEDDEIDLVELVRKLWAGRKTIVICAAAALVVVITSLHLMTYKYRAELTVTPAQSGSEGLAAKLGGLGGLASLAGVNLPQGSSALAFSLYTQGVDSRSLADAMSMHTDLMKVVFEREWNQEANRWQAPAGIVPNTARTLKTVLGISVSDWTPPGGARLQEYLKEHVSVSEDANMPFAVLSFEHEDPAFAVRFLNTVNAELDALLRKRALARANGNIAYLSEQLSKVTIAEHREAIAAALTEQEKQRMAASSSAPYAADPFGEAATPPRPTSPKPIFLLVGGSVFGFLIGMVLVLLRRQGPL